MVPTPIIGVWMRSIVMRGIICVFSLLIEIKIFSLHWMTKHIRLLKISLQPEITYGLTKGNVFIESTRIRL